MKKIDHIASLDVDPQCGFSELCPAELPVVGALEIVPELNAQAKYAKVRCASKDAHNPKGLWIANIHEPQFRTVGLPNVDIKWNRHCEVGTRGMDFLPGLPLPLEYDFVAYKGIEKDSHPYGACYHDLAGKRTTGLIEYLVSQGITTVIVGGLALNYCVHTTARQLKQYGFKVIVNLAACRGIEVCPGAIDSCIKTMHDEGIETVANTEELKRVLSL